MLRKRFLARRQAMTGDEVAAMSHAIVSRVAALPAFQQAGLIMSYLAFRHEVETRELIVMALAAGKRVAVPLADRKSRTLSVVEIAGLSEVAPGAFGIAEPKPGAGKAVPASAVDLVVAPGVAFDRRGNRLGYGAGYYDRFLPTLSCQAVTVGMAYSWQVVPALDPEPHDVPVQWLVTERAVIDCRWSAP